MIAPAEMNLDELLEALSPLIAVNAAFDGWTVKAVDSAADQTGIDPAQARLAFPKEQAAMVDCLDIAQAPRQDLGAVGIGQH